MKNNITINLIKRFILFILSGLFMVSCKKDHCPGDGTIDYHQTAVTQFVDVDKTKFAYRVLGTGTGIPLVMISSLGSSMDDWDPAITNGLAQRYKVIIFDIEGVGASSGATPENIQDMAKGVVAFIKALHYTKVNLMGFSMGSFISQQIVLSDPRLINKVILTGTGPKGAEGLSNLPDLLASTQGLTPEESFLVSHFTSSSASQTAGKLSFERMQRRSQNRDTPVSLASATAGLKAVLGWAQPYSDAFNELKGIKKPVLIVQGENDLLVHVGNAVNMASNIPGARLIIYHDAGHGAIYQYYAEFIRSAIHFLSN